jgi:NADH-ubiquinone oxidoreductase chain 6
LLIIVLLYFLGLIRYAVLIFNHPIRMILGVVGVTCFLSIYLFVLCGRAWFSYILVIVFLGGLIVSFIYVSSLIPNSSIKRFNKILFYRSPISLIFLLWFSNYNFNFIKLEVLYFRWGVIFVVIFFLLLFMIGISFISKNPFSPLKRIN